VATMYIFYNVFALFGLTTLTIILLCVQKLKLQF
jgi:hypothetical protein